MWNLISDLKALIGNSLPLILPYNLMIGCSKGTNKINRKRLLDKRVKEILFGSVDLSPIRNRWRHGIVRLSLPRFHAENKTRELREKSLGEIFLGQLQSSYIWFWGSSVPAPCAGNFFYMVLISSRKIFNENKTALFSLNLAFNFLLLKNWRKRKSTRAEGENEFDNCHHWFCKKSD